MERKETFRERFGDTSYLCRSVVFESIAEDKFGNTHAVWLDLYMTAYGYKIVENMRCKSGYARLHGGQVKEYEKGLWFDYIKEIESKGYKINHTYGDMDSIQWNRVGTCNDPYDDWYWGR
jgi:hypothetical protein